MQTFVKSHSDINGLKHEAMALMAFSEFGAIKVISYRDDVLVLERAMPGISLKSYFTNQELEAIEIVVKIIKNLHQVQIPHSYKFLHIKEWLTALDQDLAIPTQYLHEARRLRDNLLKTSSADVLLHGDLHCDNILRHGDNWVVIDPKGVIGESVYEIATFVRNPIPELLTHPNALNIIKDRIILFAKLLEVSEKRILDWCFVQAVLSWAWALEDGNDVLYFRRYTEHLASIYSHDVIATPYRKIRK